MVPPVGLDKFISPDDFLDSAVQFIHGAKGSGKTTLLLAKRVLLDEAILNREVLCVPAAFPYVFSPFMDETTISFDSWDSLAFAGDGAWKYAWLVLLGAHIFSALDRDHEKSGQDTEREKLLSEPLVKALTGSRDSIDQNLDENEWVSHFKHLIGSTARNPRETLRKLYEPEVLPKLKSTLKSQSRPVLVFVDGIDETFTGPGGSPLLKLVKAKQMTQLLELDSTSATGHRDDPNELARQIWVKAQTSLLAVATEFSIQTGGVVRLIGSMRSEAYGEAGKQGAQAVAQRANFIRAIEYTSDHLEAIMRANIRASLQMQNLEKPAKEDEFLRFFGVTSFQHPRTGVNESVFPYLCRYTFEEPRDLMLIGERLDAMNGARSNAGKVHEVVETASLVILRDYFRFMDEDWDSRFEEVVFEHVGKNILTLDEAKEIASRVAGSTKINERHPLCYLYKRGLLGIVSPQLQQVFQRIAKVEESNRSQLPRSNVYLIHPILDGLIGQTRDALGRGNYRIVQGISVGNGLPWAPGMRIKRVHLKLEGRKVQLRIDGVDLSSEETKIRSAGFRSLDDVPTAILVACILEMVNQSTNNPSFTSLDYSIKEMVTNGYLPSNTRRKGRSMQTCVYISESLLDERLPSQFETINKRMHEHNQLQISMARSLRTQTASVKGIQWEEIEIVQHAATAARGVG